MDIITRREFVKHRLSEVFAAPAGAMRDKQVTDLKRELQILDEQLLSDLPRYEQVRARHTHTDLSSPDHLNMHTHRPTTPSCSTRTNATSL